MSIGIVETKYGKVQGVECEGKYAGTTIFKGIPYAAPPVGDLRWKPPVDPASWEGVRVCDTYGDGAVQQVMTNEDTYYDGYAKLSEDCLYLNVCTPANKSDEKLPVYIWFHGGGLTGGYSYEVQFDPVEMAKRGVIVVSVGQRLGTFGYLALPQLTAEQGKSGNYGLMDQVKALDWVYENIAAFGGDPENITAGGQSGGTWKAVALAVSPASRGRVKKVIAHSVVRWLMKYYSVAEAEQIGRTYLTERGLDPDMPLEELRNLDTFAIYGKVSRDATIGDMTWDGDIVPDEYLSDTLDKLEWDIDFLGGTCFGEAALYGDPEFPIHYYGHYVPPRETPLVPMKEVETVEDFYEYYRNVLGDLYDKYDFENLVKVKEGDNLRRIMRRIASLGINIKGKNNLCRCVMKHRIFGEYMHRRYPNTHVYTYLWSHILPVRPEDYGTRRDPDNMLAFHSSELWFSFNSLRPGTPPTRPWRDVDYMMGDRICDYWCNFIKNGNPNGEGLPYWPAADENYGWIDLDENCNCYYGVDEGLDALMFEYVMRTYEIKL